MVSKVAFVLKIFDGQSVESSPPTSEIEPPPAPITQFRVGFDGAGGSMGLEPPALLWANCVLEGRGDCALLCRRCIVRSLKAGWIPSIPILFGA